MMVVREMANVKFHGTDLADFESRLVAVLVC